MAWLIDATTDTELEFSVNVDHWAEIEFRWQAQNINRQHADVSLRNIRVLGRGRL